MLFFEICLQYPTHFTASNHLVEGGQSMMCSQSGSAAKRTGKEILFINGGKHLCRAALKCTVSDTRNTQRALLLLARRYMAGALYPSRCMD